jgi:D-galactarolactone cycloisomerase
VPVSALLAGGSPKTSVPAYLSGVRGAGAAARVEWARSHVASGLSRVKVFHDADRPVLLDTVQALQQELGVEVAVDALWRLTPQSAVSLGRELDKNHALWLEAPLPPEDPLAHAALARAVRTPVALGESYRTCHELAPFFRERALAIVQPDLGRCGLTEGLRIAALAREHGVPVVPHVSIAMGPQIAAAVHFAAALPECTLLEYNPGVFEVANRFLAVRLEMAGAGYAVPPGPGLGAEVLEGRLREENL